MQPVLAQHRVHRGGRQTHQRRDPRRPELAASAQRQHLPLELC
jgi:hypothetical protein